MARVTVEDCLEQLENRFQLVLAASLRARQLANGSTAKVEWGNDKPTVVALREIASGLTGPEILDEEPTMVKFRPAPSAISEDQIVAELQAELSSESETVSAVSNEGEGGE